MRDFRVCVHLLRHSLETVLGHRDGAQAERAAYGLCVEERAEARDDTGPAHMVDP